MNYLKLQLNIFFTTWLLLLSTELIGQIFSGTASNRTNNSTLDSTLNSYQVFSLDTRQLLSYLESSRSSFDQIEFSPAPGLKWNINLESVDIFNNSRGITLITHEGRKLHHTGHNPNTYHGVFADGRQGSIRLTLNEGFIYGLINDEGTEYFIEPLKYYSQNAGDDQFVVYKSKDVKRNKSRYSCFRPSKVDFHRKENIQISERVVGSCYKAKLAVLADYSMYTDNAHPGVDAVIDHIVGVINNCQGDFIYNGNNNFNDGIMFEISEIVISTCVSCDPLPAQTNAGILLSDFSQWVDQGGFYHAFHAAQFWTNRDLNNTTVGVAFQSTNLYCQSKARALFEDWTSNAALLRATVSHEMGHTFNGVHDGSGTNFILSPSISINNVTWSASSKAAISLEIASQGPSCLLPCGATLCPKVENLSISNITTQSFTISWSSSLQNLYNVRVKEAGSETFILDYTTTSTVQVLSPPGYGICKKYDIYIYNNCSSNGLSAVERLRNIGPINQGCADFTINKKVGWRGSTFSFSDKSINATSWFWNFGDGQTSTLQNPIISFPNSGSYNISLTVNGIHTITKNEEITVLPDIPAPFLLNQGGNFESNSNHFASSVHEGTKNLWQLGTSNYRLATSGKAWKTGLNSDIGQITLKSALYTPRFDLSGYRNFTLSFDMSMEVIYCNGPFSAQLQYSTNNGETWTRLGNAPGFYNAGITTSCPISTFVFPDATGWTINANYITKSIDISFLAGIPSVIFRFEASVSGIFQLGYNIDGLLIDNFKIEAANPGVLALNTQSLRAEPRGKQVELKWEISNSSDVASFLVLRSRDGLTFDMLDSLGISNDHSLLFNYLDRTPFKQRNYYKIAAINHEGKITYTNVAKVDFESQNNMNLSPNPISQGQKLHVIYENFDYYSLDFIIMDVTGRLISIPNGKFNNVYLDTDFLEPSIYLLFIKSLNGNLMQNKFIVIK